MTDYQNIVILTGAGLSAESGLGTFRDVDGLWTKYDLNDVATPQGFARNPALVHDFYNTRREIGLAAKPNAAHIAVAHLETEHQGQVTVVTQNIDTLHEDAGTKSLIHMHGELAKVLCSHCEMRAPWRKAMNTDTPCPSCSISGGLRPDVVWFGEMPYHMDEIERQLAKANLFISIGTSGTVYPAAGFVAEARAIGAYTVELNLEPSEGTSMFHESINGPATEIVPAYVERLLNGG